MATDYLTCGQCLREFPLQCITLFIQHKKLDCDDENDLQNENPELKCNYCPQGFMTAWALLVHAQLTHNLKIFLEKASKSFLNQVKLSPVGQGDTSKKSSNIKISLPVSDEKVSGTKDTQQRLKGNSETVVSQDRDKTDHLCPVLNDIQPLTGISTKPSKMGSDFIVTRNTLTGTKKVGEKMETTLGNISLEKSVTRNTVAHVSSASQITTSQKLSLLPINQVSASFLPKLSVLPLTVSSGQIKTSSIKVLPTVLTRTGSQPPPESTVNSVLTVLKKEHSPGISVPQNDNLGLDNQMLTQETSAVLVSSTAGVPSSSASKLTQQATKSTEILTCTNIIESTQQVTSVDSKSVDSTCRTAEITVKQLQSSASVSLPTDGDNNQGNDGTGVELDSQGPECCNQQGCGVTVIPGSHEDLQECCNAVLPKKRKRHMELKHMPFSWSSSRYARRKRSAQLMSKPSTGTIYIDLEPDSSNSGERPADGTAFKVTQSASQGVKILGTSNSSMVSSGDSVSQSKPHSLILKPGAVFSIPFTYTIPTSKSLQNTIALPVARETLSLAETAQQTGSSSSSACVMVDLPKLSNEEGNQSHTSAQCMLPNLDTVAEGQILQLEKSKKYSGIATKPFQCDKCTMAFNQRIHLKKHMSKHTGIKPYKCGECNYSTVERSHLKVHIRIHTGEKPFKCTYCEYATAQNSTLKIHLKRHHGGRMFQCQKCEKQFTQEQQLKGHVLEHGSPPSLAPDQKAPSNEKFGAQQTASALQLSSPNTQASKTTQNASQVSSTDRYSSQEEVLPSQSTNQQQEPVHVDTINSISQSG